MAGRNRYKRTVEDTINVIGYAKLDETELKSVTQVLYFNENVTKEYKFIELDSNLMNELQEGQSLIFRGDKEESAVLCTEDTTYDVKEAETSNSMLLLSDLKLGNEISSEPSYRLLEERQVIGVFNKYFELRPCKPRLRKLLEILEPSEYRGREFEEDLLKSSDVKMFTYEDLIQVIQASRAEFDDACREFLVCKIGPFCRRIQHDYLFQVVTLVLNLVEENSWPLSGLIRSVTVRTLSDLVDEEIVKQVFDWLTTETEEEDEEDGEPLCRLDEEKVCRFLAEVLLRPADRFNLEDFLMAWQQSVPDGMEAHTRYLDGVALMDRKCKPEVIWYYPETSLPEDLNERIHILFKLREKWTLEEIQPYIKRLASKQMNVNAMLTKHARASTINGVKYFSAKHAK